MKIERYAVEIEMPDGDAASSTWVCDTLQSEADIEDEGRWKVSVKEQWKPSEEQMKLLKELVEDNNQRYFYTTLRSLYEQLKSLKGE